MTYTTCSSFYFFLRAAQSLKLVGFVDKESEQFWRYMIELVSDLGAADIKLLDNDDAYKCIVVWLGTWHINQMFQKLALKLLWHWGTGRLAYLLGWRSQKALKTIVGGGCFRKAQLLWRDIIYNTAKDARAYEFLKAKFVQQEKLMDHQMTEAECAEFLKDVTADDYLAWDRSNIDDANYLNSRQLMELLSALELAFTATHDFDASGMDMFYTAVLRLTPLCFGLNSFKYGPALLREISILFYRCKREFREHHRRTFNLFGKSHDEFFEERNNQQAGLLPKCAPTKDTIDFATFFMTVQTGVLSTTCNNLKCESRQRPRE